MNKPIVLLITTNSDASQSLKQDMEDVLKDKVVIESRTFSGSSMSELELSVKLPDLILTTRHFIYTYIQEIYPEAHVILAKRDLSAPRYFDKLFQIPEGEKVLVVNGTRTGAEETVEALMRLHIDHLKYVPYWENCGIDCSGIHTAITPGMGEYCPAQMDTVIDIGMRRLSPAVFMTVLETCGLDKIYLDRYIWNEKGVLIDTYKRLGEALVQSNTLGHTLQTILDHQDFAIMTYDENGSVTGTNRYAESIFGVERTDMAGRPVWNYFPELRGITEEKDVENLNGIFELNEKLYYIDVFPSRGDGSGSAGFIRMRSTLEICEKEEYVRNHTYRKNSGYTAKIHFDDMILCDSKMNRLKEQGKHFAFSSSSVLITGESGTGKELFAQSIHNSSPRNQGPFVAVNFAALPENLVESELFGYEDGAFTGARRGGKKGLFELAHGGTIFLDEIGDASLTVQSRLLRVLEQKEIMRLGDTKIRPVDIRVIAATNKNLEKMVEEGTFREDLYYRVNTLHIHIPPLRQRRSEIIPLFSFFSEQLGRRKPISADAQSLLLSHAWKGNIRELRNVAEYAMIMAEGAEIQANDLPESLHNELPQDGNTIASHEIISIQESNNMRRISEILSARYQKKEIQALLDLLHCNTFLRPPLGRTGILSALKEQGIFFSEGTLKNVLKNLERLELVVVGKTKQGTRLSDLGEAFLNYLHHSEERFEK